VEISGELSESFAPEEKTLVKKLNFFEEAIEHSTKQYKPNLLCTYLYELAQDFSHFYNNLRIIDAEKPEERSTRLALVQATAYILKKGLKILGIEVPERM
jgi:arginyl-tRNA synthetase